MTRSRPDTNDSSRQARTILLAADHQRSILAEIAGDQTRVIAYSAYGQQSAQQAITTGLGFNGELREARLGWYLLGNGYRAYNPILMRFHSPDSWSPFGKGGLNAYMYCMGDPVNFSDPTGHIKFPFKLFTRSNRPLTGAPSTSSLTPLISAADPHGGINTGLIDNVPTPMSRYENIAATTGQTHTNANIPKPMIPRLGSEVRPPIPSKQKPRFNDSGGQVGIISPNWKPGEPERFRVIFNSKPFQYPIAPVPPSRTLQTGGTRQYYVRYDADGNPKQSSVEMVTLSQVGSTIRNVTK